DPGDGRVGHAELRLADGVGFMLSDAYPELGILAPQGPGVTGAALHLHVDDCDGLVERARAAGATVLREPTTQFYGERTAALRDPFHHEWMVGQQVEDVDPAEMQRRWEAESA
ncbi:MAG: VOC family protein, partial [Myxococcales bacterium]|nr:VOC family protein [Myxococcales bacterium]